MGARWEDFCLFFNLRVTLGEGMVAAFRMGAPFLNDGCPRRTVGASRPWDRGEGGAPPAGREGGCGAQRARRCNPLVDLGSAAWSSRHLRPAAP